MTHEIYVNNHKVSIKLKLTTSLTIVGTTIYRFKGLKTNKLDIKVFSKETPFSIKSVTITNILVLSW